MIVTTEIPAGYHLARPLLPGEYIATCRDCGKLGIEDASDPAPSLCLACYHTHLHQLFTNALIAIGFSPEEVRAGLADLAPQEGENNGNS